MDDKVVAHVPVLPREVILDEDAFTVGLISATLTHPDYRRQGLATLCLRDCVRIMDKEGWPASVLWTAEATFPFYQNSGWEAVGSQGWVYRLRNGEAGLFEAGPFEVVLYDPTDERHVEAVSTIHDSEPHRIGRSPSQHRTLLALPKTGTLLAITGEQVAAYLTYGHGINKPGLIEAGGEIDGIETLVRYVLLQEMYDGEIQAIVPLTATGLGDLLERKMPGTRRPVEEADGVGFQMMRINGLEDFLQGIRGYLSRRSVGLRGDVCVVCSDSGETVSLGVNNGTVNISTDARSDKLVLSRRQLAQLIFGSHHSVQALNLGGMSGKILGSIFPFYFPVWELDHC
jgi:predicted acetyltransferase